MFVKRTAITVALTLRAAKMPVVHVSIKLHVNRAGANIHKRNKKGNTVMHEIALQTALKPPKAPCLLQVFSYFN